jgi:hypothetical protein
VQILYMFARLSLIKFVQCACRSKIGIHMMCNVWTSLKQLWEFQNMCGKVRVSANRAWEVEQTCGQ